MSSNDAHDTRLDRGLRAIGEHLPEPSPSPDTCARLTRLIEGAQEPGAACAQQRQGWGGRLHRAVGALAAMIVLGGLVWVVLAPQQPRDHTNAPPPVAHAGSVKTLVNFTHKKCNVSRQMEHRFDELAGQCRKPGLTVTKVDMTGWAPGQERDEMNKLGLGCVLSECQMPMLSGSTLIIDNEGHILAQARGDEPLDQVQRVLDDDGPSPSP